MHTLNTHKCIHTLPKTTIQSATVVLCLLIQKKNTCFSPFHWISLHHSFSTFSDQIRFLWSCKQTRCQSAGFILLKWLSPSSLQLCHSTLRMADLILPLSLSPWLLLYFSTLDSVCSLDKFGFLCCESQVFPSVERGPAGLLASEVFFFSDSLRRDNVLKEWRACLYGFLINLKSQCVSN